MPTTHTGSATDTTGLTWHMAGTKAVSVTVSNDVGTANAFATIHIEEAAAGLTARANSPTDLGDSTRLAARITGGTDVVYVWPFGDGGKATTRIANHVYSKVGSFTATVTASNDVSCISAATTVIVVNPTYGIFLSWAARR